MKDSEYNEILTVMKKHFNTNGEAKVRLKAERYEHPLSLTRASIAKRPPQSEIESKKLEAIEKYNKNAGRAFLPEIYTK